MNDYQQYIGDSETAHDVATASQVGRMAATLDVDHPATREGDPVPPGWQGAFCPALFKISQLGTSRLPIGGGVIPPVELPRRRLSGISTTYEDDILIGDRLTKITEVARITTDQSETHPSVTVTMRETFSTPRGTAVTEERGLVYVGKNGPATRAAAPTIPKKAA
ncbi:MAG: hypothetical protein QGF09_10835 [Rhodospirillales bacterium]|jgi:hydroxyacyl-ACP dehydratase HTD2-like protein with hotdog domain|nr:hypothetical protein [Rhodospirillales bacterium]